MSDRGSKSWDISHAVASDLEDIVAFSTIMAWESEGRNLQKDVVRASLVSILDDSSMGRIFVARDGNRPIGYTMVSGYEWSDWRDGKFLWMTGMYVLPEYRRKGIRKALYDKVRDWARTQPKVLGIRAYVHENNKFTLIFMRRTSYQILEELFDLPGQQ